MYNRDMRFLSIGIQDNYKRWIQRKRLAMQQVGTNAQRDREDEGDEEEMNEGNADHFDKLPTIDSFDEDDGDFQSSPGGANVEGSEVSGELETQEAEIGIRRSSAAKSSKIEDLTLSDVILDPDGNITYYWLGAVTTAVVYNIAVVVLRLAFKEMRDPVTHESVFYVCDSLGDLTYVLDIFVHLRVSFYEDGCLVLDPKRIVERYTKSRKFVVDILAIAPLGTVFFVLSGIGSFIYLDLTTFITGDVYILIVRIPRLLKYPTMIRFFDLTDSRTRNPNLLRAFKLSLNLWLVIHWVGCVYYMLSEYEGLGTTGWVYPSGPEYAPFTRKYIRVMYWSLMTLTTIGERPSPETDLEFVFTGFTFLIGVFVFAAVVGNVGDVITNMNAARQEFQSRMDQIKSYLQHRHVEEHLQNRVKRWANYTWTRTQAIDEPTLLQMLPDRLRTEIAINVHLETLKKVKIFEECEEGLLRELVLKLRPQVYSPGDYICRIGEVGREMYIVNHGKVEILVPSSVTGKRAVIATLTPGNYFGEISLLKIDDGQNRRTADVRAVGYSELLRLSRKDLMSALVEYPNAKRILEQQAMERMHKTNQMRRSSTVDEAATPLCATPDERAPGMKKDMLIQVIKSPKFQKLLSSRNSDAKELKQVIEELRQFDSQATREKINCLTKERNDLKQELAKTTEELELLRRKLTSVLAFRRTSSGHNYMKMGCGGKQKLTRTSRIPVGSVCYHSDSERPSCYGSRVVRTETFPPVRLKPKTLKRNLTNGNSVMDHVARESMPKCTCRSIQHSFSVPNIVTRPTSVSDRDVNPFKATQSFNNFTDLKSNGSLSRVDNSNNESPKYSKGSESKMSTIPIVHVHDIEPKDNSAPLEAKTDDPDTEKDLQLLNDLLTLDPDNYLSDTSARSSNDSSDDCDLDYDLEI